MKRVCVFLMLFFLSLPSIAQVLDADNIYNPNTFPPPQWEEFCPVQFLYVTYKKPGKFITHKTNNYWAGRKKNFQEALNSCFAHTQKATEVEKCLSQLREIEKNKTDIYKYEEFKRQNQQMINSVNNNRYNNDLFRDSKFYY